jgi:hypothetical protein
MVCLASVDDRFETRGDSIGVNRRTYNKERSAPDIINDASHIIIKDAGTRIVALITPYATPYVQVMRINNA